MSSSLPTMMDVARKAGVGIATVDRVLNRRAAVRKDTEERVLQAASEIGFELDKFRIAEDQKAGRSVRTSQWRLAFVLLKQTSTFYQEMAKAIRLATSASSWLKGEPEILFLEHESPHQVAQLLLELGTRFDAIALVTLDHPAINQAIDTLSTQGVPVFSMITDVTAGRRAGYLGIDNRKAGRTAAWAIARMTRGPGKIGILIGDHRFLCQELSEISFRSWFRERQPGYQVLDPALTLECVDRAREVTQSLLEAHSDLVGLYVSGGGVEGVIDALRHSERQRDIVVVCTDLTEVTRAALVDEVVDVVLSHPREALARAMIEAMAEHLHGGSGGGTQVHLLPFEIVTIESL